MQLAIAMSLSAGGKSDERQVNPCEMPEFLSLKPMPGIVIMKKKKDHV